jgi:hypothetical protein
MSNNRLVSCNVLVVMSCSLVGGYQCFRGTLERIFNLKMEAVGSSDILVTTYKTT